MLAQVERLNGSLGRSGEEIIVRRYSQNGSTQDFTVLGKVRALAGEEIRKGSSGVQLAARVILSPTGLEAILPLRTTDKIVRDGQERQIGWVDNLRLGTEYVRVTADIQG